MQRFNEDDVEIVCHGTAELWDQMRNLVRTLPWTSQDEAAWQLLPEMKNVFPVFAIRKSDQSLLGGGIMVETDVVYGAAYVMKSSSRGLGIGTKLTAHIMDMISEASKRKVVIIRAVPSMIDKYSGPPFYAVHHHKMYAFTLPRVELLEMFPSKGSYFTPKRLKEVNALQFDKACAFDTLVSGRNRRDFLKEYHSLFFTEGVALFGVNNEVHGLAGALPTLHDSQKFKIGPLFAESRNDACYLIKCIADAIPNPDATFVLHITTESAGDWMLQRCNDAGIPLSYVGTAANCTYNGIIYKDPCKTEFMYAPMNCPIYFDR